MAAMEAVAQETAATGTAAMGRRGKPHGAHGAGASESTEVTGEAEGSARPGRAERRKLQRRVKRRRQRSALKEIPLLISVALAIALILKVFLVQAFVIPSGSMEQTIRIGDRVLVDKLTPWFGAEPSRGDVVVFRDPGGWLADEQSERQDDDPFPLDKIKDGLTFIGILPSADDRDLIKRVVGVGGDRVTCCDDQGRLKVNGVPLTEDYLYPGVEPSEDHFDITVPEGRLWVMGDHRNDSADSRAHRKAPYGGTVSEEQVVGRAMVIAWPVDHWRRLEEPAAYASVPDAMPGATAAGPVSHRVSHYDPNGMIQLPIPAELPHVMGVVGLRRARSGPWQRVRSWRGGCGGRHTVRTGRRRVAREPCRRRGSRPGRRAVFGERLRRRFR